MTEEIRKISNELFVMGNTVAKLRIENAQLKHHVKSSEGRHESTLRARMPENVLEVDEDESESDHEYDPEEGNRTINYTSYNTTRNRNKTRRKPAEPKEGNPAAKRVKYLETELEVKQREVAQLQREKSYC